jgi:hypothetical protein
MSVGHPQARQGGSQPDRLPGREGKLGCELLGGAHCLLRLFGMALRVLEPGQQHRALRLERRVPLPAA